MSQLNLPKRWIQGWICIWDVLQDHRVWCFTTILSVWRMRGTSFLPPVVAGRYGSRRCMDQSALAGEIAACLGGWTLGRIQHYHFRNLGQTLSCESTISVQIKVDVLKMASQKGALNRGCSTIPNTPLYTLHSYRIWKLLQRNWWWMIWL